MESTLLALLVRLVVNDVVSIMLVEFWVHVVEVDAVHVDVVHVLQFGVSSSDADVAAGVVAWI